MSHIRIGEITSPARSLAPDDSLRRAVDLLTASSAGAIAVVDQSQIVGLVTSRSITENVPPGEFEQSQNLPVSVAMVSNPVIVEEGMRLELAADLLQKTGAPALVVATLYGGYLGIVGRTELLSALWGSLKLPPIAGMATPLGVHLTTGSLRAGPGNLGLFLTGVMMAVLFQVALGVGDLAIWGLGRLGIPAQALINSTPTGAFGWMDLIPWIYQFGMFLLFLVLVRFSPLSGYHAAEHQVVHAIEHFEDLVPQKVRLMPRPHPRCGTNLLVLFGLGMVVVTLWTTMGDLGQLISLPIILIGLMSWKRIGWMIQQYFTTKPASTHQMESGIRAGTELAAKYRENPGKPASFVGRLWNAGFLQVLTGLLLMGGVRFLITWLWRFYNG